MDHLSFLSDYNILVLLAELLLIVGLSKLLAWPLGRIGFSALPAELLAGIILGPTILGRLNPQLFTLAFPADKIQHFMLDAIGWLGILFVLLTTGMEINLSSAWRQRKQVLQTTLVSFFLPLLIAIPVVFFLPPGLFPDGQNQVAGRILLAVLLVALALPITLRVMGETGILRSDFGMLSAASFSLSDLLGWIIVMGIVAIPASGGTNLQSISRNTGLIVLLLVVAFLTGFILRKRFDARPLKLRHLSPVNREFTIMVLMGLGFGSASTFIGIHAFFGFFLAGLVLGVSRVVKESSATSIGTFMETIFVPVFFASAGLRFDFVQNFNILLFVLFSICGFALRITAGYLAARVAGLPRGHQRLFAVLNSPGGELHVIAALIAWESRLIDTQLLVAIISGALFSSMAAAPLINWLLKTSKEQAILDFLAASTVIHELKARARTEVLREICKQAGAHLRQDAEGLFKQVMDRELSISTALGKQLAFPHARISGLGRPLIIPARSRQGINDWEGPDGKKVRLVFLILSPLEQEDLQLQILRQLIKGFQPEAVQDRLLSAGTDEEFYAGLRDVLAGAHIPLTQP